MPAGTRAVVAASAPIRCEIRLQDEPTYRWKGRMDFVDNTLDTGSGTIRGRAVVDNPDALPDAGHVRPHAPAGLGALSGAC